MRRIIITTLIALTALGGVASADRYRGNNYRGDQYRRDGGVRVERYRNVPRHNARNYRSTYVRPNYRVNNRSNYRVYNRPNYRVYNQPRVRVVRQPIYVQRPVIRHRYYNYYQRPTLIVENYPARHGYIWVRGSWQWNGFEWIWQPGHYQPDPAFDQYYNGYQNPAGYYDANGTWIDTSGGYYNY